MGKGGEAANLVCRHGQEAVLVRTANQVFSRFFGRLGFRRVAEMDRVAFFDL